MSFVSSDSPQILAYFKEFTDWSLISFLNFRKDADNFTGDKATEHFNYRTALERIVLLDDSNRVKAKECLIRLEVSFITRETCQIHSLR